MNQVSIFIAMAFVCVVLLLSIVWSIRRHLDPKLNIECDSPIEDLIPSLAGLTLSSAIAGNSVEVFENGAYFDELLRRIPTAEHSVHFETFLWQEGVLGKRVADALSERARAGKQVRVLLDADGSKKIGKAVKKQMEDAGCRVAFFHEKSFGNLGVLNDRDHRKLVVIDGREAFVGGHCIVDSGWQRRGPPAQCRREREVARPDREQHSVRVQRELGRTDWRAVRRPRCISDAEAGGGHPDPCRVRQSRRARRRPSRSCITR